jgi:3-dehydroquinate dehydratase-2
MQSNNSQKANILVLNGPNINLLGTREPDIYGHKSLADIEADLKELASGHTVQLIFKQSNSESELIDQVQQARGSVDHMIVNAAGYSHTSIALRDALSAVAIPFYEVHISNIYQREQFRHHSYLADIAAGTLSGFGPFGYSMALLAIIKQLKL